MLPLSILSWLASHVVDDFTVVGSVAALVAAATGIWTSRIALRRPKLDVSIWERCPALIFDAATFQRDGADMPMKFVPDLQVNNTGSKAALSGCFVAIWLPKRYRFDEDSLRQTGWTAFSMKDSFDSDPSAVYWKIERYIAEPAFFGHALRLPSFTIESPNGEADIELRWQVWYESGHDPKGEPGRLKVGVRLPSLVHPVFADRSN